MLLRNSTSVATVVCFSVLDAGVLSCGKKSKSKVVLLDWVSFLFL